MQKTITIKGRKLTASAIRKANQAVNGSGMPVAEIPGVGDVHWMDWDGETHVFNAGAVHRKAAFGSKIAFLS